MHNRLYLVILIFFLVIGFYSCSQKEIFYQYEEIKGSKWSQSIECIFYIDSASYDSLQSYDIWLEIVHNTAYKYQDLWVGYTLELDTDTVYSEKHEIQYLIANSDGKWKGSGFGSSYQLSLPLLSNFYFDKGETRKKYRIRISQRMADYSLQGIEKVGIRIEKAKIQNYSK